MVQGGTLLLTLHLAMEVEYHHLCFESAASCLMKLIPFLISKMSVWRLLPIHTRMDMDGGRHRRRFKLRKNGLLKTAVSTTVMP